MNLSRARTGSSIACFLFCVLLLSQALPAGGARLFKSGPIQITADGSRVWVANADNDSVSRINTADEVVTEFLLPDPATQDSPRGLSLLEDGSEVWVACHDSDRIYVLAGDDGSVEARIDLPWGSGPYSIALSRDGEKALATLHRSAALAAIDVRQRRVIRILEPLYFSPLGVAWMEDGMSAWVTHLFADANPFFHGNPFLTRVDFSGSEPRVAARIIIKPANPKQSSPLAAPQNVAEGGYLNFRGHLAQIPSASGRKELWLPTQYSNFNEDVFTPDSTMQSTVRRLNLANNSIRNSNADRLALSAVHIHDPETDGSPYVGPGWDARISGAVDVGFSSDGRTAYLLNEQSNDLIILPTNTPPVKPPGASPLPEVPVGDRPMGLAVSPIGDLAYVANSLSRDVSVVDLKAKVELRRIPVTPLSGEPFSGRILTGAKIFYSSADRRISRNDKVACASCHPHGEHDGWTWDFQRLPGVHGPRLTSSLLGLALTMGSVDPGTGFGQLHRSGDRDELQDFEHSFQGPLMGGTGFLGNRVQPELGPPNAGLSEELDGLTDYILSLKPLMRSPHRAPDGSLTEAAIRGATFFTGADRAARPADAGCASCHVPETGFVDFKFHDVGQRRTEAETELNDRSPAWAGNTPTLIGVWSSPPYEGATGYASTMLHLLENAVMRAGSATPHGRPDGLTGRQLEDLAEFVLSIDGNMTASEVHAASDRSPPRVVRVAPASLTAVDVWFSETVDPGAASPSKWRIERAGGAEVEVTAAAWDSTNGDRITLTTALKPSCALDYRIIPNGIILDAAATTSGGIANALDLSDLANTHELHLTDRLTVTLGASGFENITIAVHDAGMDSPTVPTSSHDAPWLFSVYSGTVMNTGFVRFEWQERFRAISGITRPEDILEASFSLFPEWGDSQGIELRRVLQAWSNPAPHVSGGNEIPDPVGGPTWRDHSHPSGKWNTPGARALGGKGDRVADYDGSFDLAEEVEAASDMPAINERVVFGGEGVTAAFRFWFENPRVDYGYGLRLVEGSKGRSKFQRVESERGKYGPILTLTYRLPASGECEPVLFHRGDPDASGEMDITDAVFLLRYLFTGGASPSCLESADAQNDGQVDLSDAIFILLYLFGGKTPPAAPGPTKSSCGLDPDPQGSAADLGCVAYRGC